MRVATGIVAVAALVALHLAALFALLHPNVSREYRAFYIERVSSDWHVTHYVATPELGIDFSVAGWPEFVDHSFGISKLENFGRWTDTRLGLQAGFEFNHTFSGPVCVVIDAKPSNSMRSQSVPLAFGDQEKEISFGQDLNFSLYFVDFELPNAATRLALLFPKPLPRVSYFNPREVGVGLNRIRIFSRRCSEVSELPSEGH